MVHVNRPVVGAGADSKTSENDLCNLRTSLASRQVAATALAAQVMHQVGREEAEEVRRCCGLGSERELVLEL